MKYYIIIFLARIKRYTVRILYWKQVAGSICGVDRTDRKILRSAYLRAPITALSDLDVWQDPIVTRDVRVEVPGVGRFNVRAGSDDLHHVVPAREPEVFRALHDLLRAGDTFVDAGANIGFYTVLAARLVGPTGRVVAVEMMPDTAAILREHVRLNGLNNVRIVENALSARVGERVVAHVETGKFGQASIAGSARGQAITVETTTLDAVLQDVDAIRLMKMDLEGAEYGALCGAERALSSVRAVIFETLLDSTDAANLLAAQGFEISALSGRDSLAVRR